MAEILHIFLTFPWITIYIGGLVQERRNSIANTLELRLPCINPSIYDDDNILTTQSNTGCVP